MIDEFFQSEVGIKIEKDDVKPGTPTQVREITEMPISYASNIIKP